MRCAIWAPGPAERRPAVAEDVLLRAAMPSSLTLLVLNLLHAINAVFYHEVHQEEGVGLLSLSGDGGALSRKGSLEGGG
jgi:hypothetical protein